MFATPRRRCPRTRELALRRAVELTADERLEARVRCGGDVRAKATQLDVGEHALRLRIRELEEGP